MKNGIAITTATGGMGSAAGVPIIMGGFASIALSGATLICHTSNYCNMKSYYKEGNGFEVKESKYDNDFLKVLSYAYDIDAANVRRLK